LLRGRRGKNTGLGKELSTLSKEKQSVLNAGNGPSFWGGGKGRGEGKGKKENQDLENHLSLCEGSFSLSLCYIVQEGTVKGGRRCLQENRVSQTGKGAQGGLRTFADSEGRRQLAKGGGGVRNLYVRSEDLANRD